MALDKLLAVSLFLLASATAVQSAAANLSSSSQRPLVIGHRGSSGVLPEHTVEAYERAVSDGADVIECDVTLSKDLVPVCLHENLLQETTDVADRPEFADRNRSLTYNNSYGQEVTDVGWFAFDFTLTELKTLRKRQPLSFRDHTLDGELTIATLDEHIAVAQRATRPVAIYPEIKSPGLINSLDILCKSSQRFEDIVLDALESKGYRTADDHCLIQSFSERSLSYLKNKTQLRLVMLIAASVPNEILDGWSQMLYGVGVWVNVIAPHWTAASGYKNTIGNQTTDFVARAHSYGLQVHVWTLRNEDRYLAWDFGQDVNNAYDLYLSQDVDGLFTDFPQSLATYLDLLYKNNSCEV